MLWRILAAGAGVFGLRIAGFAIPGARVPRAWQRALAFVPVAVLTALVVSSLAAEASSVRLIAAAAAAAAAWWTKQMWVCLLVGMGVYWLLHLV